LCPGPRVVERQDVETTDARGRPLEVVEFDRSGTAVVVGGRSIGGDYLNFYQANGALVVPTTGTEADLEALDVLRGITPDRVVVGVPTPVLGYGGGGIHCITQQVPAEGPVSPTGS
jgi:agmatine deiminase